MVSNYALYYDVIEKLSSFIGAWPYLKPRIKMQRAGFITVIVFTTIVPHVAKFITCKKDMQCILESMASYLLMLQFLVKLYTFIIQNHNIKKLTDHLFFDWEELKTPEEYEIMKSYAKNSRRFSILYPIYIFLSVFLFLSLSLIPYISDIISPLNETRPIIMPYPGHYFVDERKYFIYIYLHSVVAAEISIITLSHHDCMFVFYVEHVCSMLSIIRLQCTQLVNNFNGAMETMNIHVNDVYYKRVKSSVQLHQKVLAFTKLLEDTFTISFLIQLAIVISAMSISLLQVELQSDAIVKTGKFVIYILAQLLHIFSISFEGQRLIDHSLQVHDTIYDSYWYEVPAKTQKLLNLMMIKSRYPIFLSAGKIYVFSLKSFNTILQTAVSYFTVLRTV